MSDKAHVQTEQTQRPRASAPGRLLQRKCACGGPGWMSGECEECHREKLIVQRSPSPPASSATGRNISLLLGGDASSLSSHEPAAGEVRTVKGTPSGHDFSRMRVYASRHETSELDLSLSQPGDELEREADRMAENALRAPVSPASSTDAARLAAGRERLQTKRESVNTTGGAAHVPAPLGSVLGSGQPLPAALKDFFGARFGHDFNQVRIHTGSCAAASARSVNALAYTVGRDVVFGEGQFAPGTKAGDKLLAHELAHVIQQQSSPALATRPPLLRQRCGHDGRRADCGASGGRWELFDIDDPNQVTESYGLDDRIVDMGLARYFAGTWLKQVQTPPNRVKHGADRGRVDGLKVSASGVLRAEVVEVKSRAAFEGGCARATSEANGYVDELRSIAPRVVALSHSLALKGGLRAASSQNLRAAERKMLEEAGSYPKDPAWLFYNSLQNKLNTTFTTGFAGMEVSTNADGSTSDVYDAGPPVRIDCPKSKTKGKKKSILGSRQLKFMVNKKGGISYGCEVKCDEAEEEEKEKVKEVPKEVPEVKPFALEQEEEETKERQPVTTTPQGVETVDIIAYTLATLGTIALLHKAASLLKGKERELAIKTVENLTKEIAKRGLAETAKRLDSENIGKLGQKAYEKQLEMAARELDDVAKRVPKGRLLKKLGPKVGKAFLKNGARVFIVVGIVMAAADAYAIVDQVSKGAELEIGFSADETELKGDTKVETKGTEGKPKPEVSGDVKLTDTKIDIEMQGVPKFTGTADIETKNVTIKGKMGWKDGDPVTVNFKTKIENTTITFKHSGIIKGNGVVLDEASEISNSTIEIDLPPGAVAESGSTGQPVSIKNQKLKITSVGKSSGTGAQGESKGEETTPAKDLEELLKQVRADEQLNMVMERLRGDKFPVTEEMLRRFLALKPQMGSKPEAVKKFLDTFQHGEKDPIEALAQFLQTEEEKSQKEQGQGEGSGEKGEPGKEKVEVKDKAQGTGEKAEDAGKEGTGKEGIGKEGTGKEGTGQGTTGGTGTGTLANVRSVSFAKVYEQISFPSFGTEGTSTPFKKVAVPGVWTTTIGGVERTYKFAVIMKLKSSAPTQPGFNWIGIYQFTPPSGVIKSTKGDHPIQFIGGETHVESIGQYKSQPKTTEKKKK